MVNVRTYMNKQFHHSIIVLRYYYNYIKEGQVRLLGAQIFYLILYHNYF